MEILPFMPTSMLPVSTVFLAFFCASFFVLFLIACVTAPEWVRSIRRFRGQMGARKTRSERMLADPEQLKTDARKLEGVYRFDSIEPHSSPSQTGVTSAARASLASSAALR